MELDKRIESIDYIFTPFSSIALVTLYKGKKGYFSNNFEMFSNLDQCDRGVLTNLVDEDTPYNYKRDNGETYKYFLPDEAVDDEEPKFRPFTLCEFLVKFPMVTVITFKHREDEDPASFTFAVMGYRTKSNGSTDICLGADWYSFKEFAEEYLYKNTSGEWVAFGVKEL